MEYEVRNICVYTDQPVTVRLGKFKNARGLGKEVVH